MCGCETRREPDDGLSTLRQALSANRVSLAYQPVVSAQPGHRLAFYEGLARIHDAAGQLLPLAPLLDAAQGAAAASALDRATLDHALGTLADRPTLRLSVNIDPTTLHCPLWMAMLASAARRDPTLVERLIVEITECAALHPDHDTLRAMAALQTLGVSLALDDFGAGQTSFRYFQDFRFDIVKIDGRYARQIADRRDNQAILSALTGIAQHFDMMVVAEFVETARDADCLAALGVDCCQGYHFGRPAPLPVTRTATPRAA